MMPLASYGLISRIYIYPNSRIMKKSYGVPIISAFLPLNLYGSFAIQNIGVSNS